MNIKFSPPDIAEEEICAVADTLRSGWITTGPRTKQFEKEIAQYVESGLSDSGTPRCVCLNSQTACAEMALKILGIGEGDEVITTAYTYTASASVVRHVGAKLVLVDTQEGCFEMDYDAVEKAVNDRTKVIIPVDIGGVPCDYGRIYDIVNKKRALFKPSSEMQWALGRVAVLADTAHSFGAKRQGKAAGCLADFSAFSFHAVKNLTTAEGGALTWTDNCGIDSKGIYRQLQLLSLHGQSKDAFAKTAPGAWEYDIVDTWYKCNMTDMAASIGLSQLKRYPAMLERRKEIIGMYDGAFKPLGVEVLPHYTDSYQSSGHLYMTNIPSITAEQRNQIIVEMGERGVACNVHYKPLPMHTAYKKLGFDIKDYPNAYARFTNQITLPLHSRLTDGEAEYVIENFINVLRGYKC